MTLIPTITPSEVDAEHNAKGGVRLIDVREVDEYEAVRAPYGENFPMSRLQRGDLPVAGRSERVYLVCKAGGRSEAVAKAMMAAGFTDVVSVKGGMTAWEKAGLAVVKGS